LRFDLPGDTLPERVPEEEVEARLRVVRWLAALSDQAQSVYAKSPEAEPEVTEEYAERRAKFYVILGEAA
jgi:hypothetical protein